MDNLKLGQIIEEGRSVERDALHIAVAPVVAAQRLEPGHHVGIRSDGKAFYWNAGDGKTIGIVDPFLTAPVQEGQRFWLYLYPGSLTSLRHDWTHPAFPSISRSNTAGSPQTEAIVTAALKELESIADELGMPLSDLTAAAEGYLSRGDYMTEHGGTHWQSAFDGNEERFWRNYAVVTGRLALAGRTDHFFSCSC